MYMYDIFSRRYNIPSFKSAERRDLSFSLDGCDYFNTQLSILSLVTCEKNGKKYI